jgi:hypothetical protein
LPGLQNPRSKSVAAEVTRRMRFASASKPLRKSPEAAARNSARVLLSSIRVAYVPHAQYRAFRL